MSISDVIEQYLKQIIHKNEKKMIEIKRSEIANLFQCVPSQINYVINTRFTLERGYMIESKRGGGGFIRISRIEHQDEYELIGHLIEMVGREISQSQALDILDRLLEKKVITTREKRLISAAIDRETLAYHLPERDLLRARILKAVLANLQYVDRRKEEK